MHAIFCKTYEILLNEADQASDDPENFNMEGFHLILKFWNGQFLNDFESKQLIHQAGRNLILI
jgi:hypothetical protein